MGERVWRANRHAAQDATCCTAAATTAAADYCERLRYLAATSKGAWMETTLRWTSADLEVLPDDGKRYEIIDGELYVSR
jgi:hypothetical protein